MVFNILCNIICLFKIYSDENIGMLSESIGISNLMGIFFFLMGFQKNDICKISKR